MEYDTYRDPVGPLSASAQFLYGAIANFITGLADMPAEVVLDLVSATRAIGHPQEHFKRSNRWRVRKSRREDGSASEEDTDQPSAARRSRVADSSSNSLSDNLGEDEDAEEDEEEDIISEDSLQGSDSTLPAQDRDRRRSLQLEKTQTMGSELNSSQKHHVFSEIVYQGGRFSKKFINLVIWLPTDLTLSLSKGFHNAPKLYHDPMVKKAPKVHGVQSGFRAAGKVCSRQFLLP